MPALSLPDLQEMSLFELYRLSALVHQQLDDPNRIAEIKQHLRVGQTILYFCMTENRLIEAEIEALKRNWVHIRHVDDGKCWRIVYGAIKLSDADISLMTRSQHLTRETLQVGDVVGFQSKEGQEINGQVIRLNPKTATLKTATTQWRVSYSLLHPVVDVDMAPFASLPPHLP